MHRFKVPHGTGVHPCIIVDRAMTGEPGLEMGDSQRRLARDRSLVFQIPATRTSTVNGLFLVREVCGTENALLALDA